MKANNVITATIIASAALLTGCAGSPMATSMATPAELKAMSTMDLCAAYGSFRNPEMAAELETRPEITYRDEIANKQIRLGMSEVELVCSWGRPRKVNKTVSAGGVRKQIIYGRRAQYGKYGKYSSDTTKYVYTRNNKITSWSN